jgi:hypothetical protein
MTKAVQGRVSRVANAFDNMITGTINVTFPAQAIFQTQRRILEVLVQNDPDSTVNAMVGNEFGQYVVLIPGASIVIPISDLNKVHVGTGAGGGTATINYIAMT